jgi:hypothetical protein
MMAVMTMMMVCLRKCGSRNHQDHGKKQSLFHANIITNKGITRMPSCVTFGLPTCPDDVRPGSGETFECADHGVVLAPGTEEEDKGDEQVNKVEIG